MIWLFTRKANNTNFKNSYYKLRYIQKDNRNYIIIKKKIVALIYEKNNSQLEDFMEKESPFATAKKQTKNLK